MKRNIAIIIPGGIGTGHNNIGVPVLERIVKLLATDFNLIVFQLHPINETYKVEGFELIGCYSANPLLKSLKFILAFLKVHRKRKFQVAHGFWAFPSGFLAVLMGKIFKIKSIISLQGGDAIALPEIQYGQLLKWLPRKLILWALQQADELISPTRYMIDNLRNYGLTRNEVKYIPLGVDLLLFKFHEKKIEIPVRFLHIGNFNRVKDQATLLKAFEVISRNISSQLIILGEGELENEIKSLALELKLRDKIIFHPTIPYESLPRHYHQSDVLLHTSLSEGHPIVVEEAMSCGVLVCGTNVGLLYDHPACCVSVPVGDFQMLATEVLKLLQDEKRMKLIRKNAYSWASAHSIHWTMSTISNLYEKLIRSHT